MACFRPDTSELQVVEAIDQYPQFAWHYWILACVECAMASGLLSLLIRATMTLMLGAQRASRQGRWR